MGTLRTLGFLSKSLPLPLTPLSLGRLWPEFAAEHRAQGRAEAPWGLGEAKGSGGDSRPASGFTSPRVEPDPLPHLPHPRNSVLHNNVEQRDVPSSSAFT